MSSPPLPPNHSAANTSQPSLPLNTPPLSHLRTRSASLNALQASQHRRSPSSTRQPSESHTHAKSASTELIPPDLDKPKGEDAAAAVARILDEERAKGSVSLNLAQRSLSRLPPEIGTMVTLERLGLSDNLLSSLPPEIARLSHLRYLKLRSNQFREFPMVICQLPALEILDLSRNKLKRLPTDFGKLINLKVLSLARNRIQRLPTYIGLMKDLKVLKIEHNPIEWPPPIVTQCSADLPHETWVENLKEYLKQEGSRLDPVMEISATQRNPSPLGNESEVSWRETTTDGGLSSGELQAFKERIWEGTVHECDQLMHKYSQWRSKRTSPRKETSGKGQSGQILEAARGMAYAFVGMYKTIRKLYAKAAVGFADTAFVLAIRRQMDQLNGDTCSLIMFLSSIESGTRSTKTGTISDEELPPSGSQSSTNGNLNWTAEAKQHVLAAVASAKSLITTMQSSGRALLNGLDMRESRALLAEWYASTVELADALQKAGGTIYIASPSVSSPAVVTPNASDNEQQPRRHIVDPTIIRSMATSATAAAANILTLLKDLPQVTARLANQKDGSNAALSPAKTTDLSTALVLVDESTRRLATSLGTEIADTPLQRRTAEDARHFIKAIAQMSAAARTIALNCPLGKPVMAGLHTVTRTAKELAMALATQRTGPSGDTSVQSGSGMDTIKALGSPDPELYRKKLTPTRTE